MLVRLISGSLSAIAFSVAVIAGLYAGNPITTILLRAWAVMMIYLILGLIVGWIAQVVYDEYRANLAKQKEIPTENEETMTVVEENKPSLETTSVTSEH